MHIGITGAPGTGKTTLAEALVAAVPELFLVYMSRFAVRIPMALRATSHPNILDYSREEYIRVILANQNVPELPSIRREEMDDYGMQVIRKYGASVIGKTALSAVPRGRTAVFDGTATADNVRFMKRNGVFIVGLCCAFETQVQRRIKKPRDIDPQERSALERQVLQTAAFYQMDACLRAANAIYNTDNMRTEEIVPLVLHVIQYS